ncbi:hypothetical protein [Stackebrandtia nassauensis]|uniref:Uncharacterized protein n=1 Tax=Stackebrandtia nassauensis (strain DSM 44728 / CIP 108903 / NRRL B-16338 / NBRC 102104 / LLR-40K-21) TaxID=446470 RepID=D3Q2E4_STANL|nr:hypothetical protein [Stackebrandtia nassauensis]ADD43877.1 hypothetical protein Snas_4228 [Stackebrandtia nassauensis DSM 44728]
MTASASPPLASIDALETLLAEPLVGRRRQRAGAVLAGVSAEVRAVAGRRWTNGAPDLAVSITLKAAERAIVNPQGLSAENLGDYGRRFGGSGPAGVYLTEGEVDALVKLTEASGVVSVPVERDVTLGGTPVSDPAVRM